MSSHLSAPNLALHDSRSSGAILFCQWVPWQALPIGGARGSLEGPRGNQLPPVGSSLPASIATMVFTLTVTVSPSFQVFPHTSKPASSLPRHHTISQPGHPGLWVPVLRQPFCKVAAHQDQSGQVLSQRPGQLCRALLKAWRFRSLSLLPSSPSPMGRCSFWCGCACVTLVCPLSLFSSLIPIYPIPGIKFLIKFIGLESVFLTRP